MSPAVMTVIALWCVMKGLVVSTRTETGCGHQSRLRLLKNMQIASFLLSEQRIIRDESLCPAEL